MESEVAAAAASKGSLASIGSSLASVGTASKAFTMVHPLGVAATGGAILGVGAYMMLGKMFRKKEPILVEEAAPVTA